MGLGALGQIGGMVLGYNADKGESEDARRAQQAQGWIYDAYLGDSQAQNKWMTDQQRQFSMGRMGASGDLAAALGGGGGYRNVAMQGAQQQSMAGIQQAMGKANAANPDGSGSRFTNGGGAGGGWAARGGRKTGTMLNPAMAFTSGQAGQAAAGTYDQNAYNHFGERVTDIGRQSNETGALSQLLQAERDRQMNQNMQHYGYQGPGQGYYNQMMAGQLLQMGGQAYDSYANSRTAGQPAGYSNSTQNTYRLQGPAR